MQERRSAETVSFQMDPPAYHPYPASEAPPENWQTKCH